MSQPGQYGVADVRCAFPNACTPPQASRTNPPLPPCVIANPRTTSHPGQYGIPVVVIGGDVQKRWMPPHPSIVAPRSVPLVQPGSIAIARVGTPHRMLSSHVRTGGGEPNPYTPAARSTTAPPASVPVSARFCAKSLPGAA